MNPQKGEEILNVLKERDQKSSLVTLVDGKTLNVFNIAWGRDMGSDYDHITTNISPGVKDSKIDIFLTSEVTQIKTPEGEILFEISGE